MLAERVLVRFVRALKTVCATVAIFAVVVICVVVVMAPVGVTADPPLSIEPTSGLSGALVTVTPGFTKPSQCSLELDEQFVKTFTCGAEADVQLTVNGQPGTHTITVCAPSCDGNNPSESAMFMALTTVPNLTGLTVNEAQKRLSGSNLRLGQVTGTTGDPATTVSTQSPDAGAAVPADSQVGISLGAAAPTLVQVPKLVGLTVRRASGLLKSAGLNLGTAPSHGYVAAQRPAPGTQVPLKYTVTVTVRNTVAVHRVTVPELRGDSLAKARQKLSDAGLSLLTKATSGTVATQSLNAGRRVPRGTTVSVTVRPILTTTNVTKAPASTSVITRYGGPAVIALLLLMLLLTAGLVARYIRHRGDRPLVDTGPVPRVVTRATNAGVNIRSLRQPPTPPVEFHTSRFTTLTMERKP